MEALKYKIIKTEKQYDQYCNDLEMLIERKSKTKSIAEEIELITYLIEKWDNEHNSFDELDPISILKHLMEEHSVRQKDLADILQVSKGLVSDILNYKKGLSKEIIRILALHFKVTQEAFNRPYKIISPVNSHLRNASIMNTKKELVSLH